jgi:hypothetical protein
MFHWLIDRYFDLRRVRYRRKLPAFEWQPLLDQIREQIREYTVFLETRNHGFVSLEDFIARPRGSDVVAVAIAYVADGVAPWDTETPARVLADRLSPTLGFTPLIFSSRDPDSFVGYYVRIGSD